MKNVMTLTGAGQIGMAIARRMGYGMKIIIGDKKLENAQSISKILNNSGFDTFPLEMDLSSRISIQNMISEAQKYGKIKMLVKCSRSFTKSSINRNNLEGRFIRNGYIIRRSWKSYFRWRCWCYNFKSIWQAYATAYS